LGFCVPEFDVVLDDILLESIQVAMVLDQRLASVNILDNKLANSMKLR